MTKTPKKPVRKAKPYLKGFPCPNCRGHRLFVRKTDRPLNGVIVRYRECVTCGEKLVTEERKRKPR